MLSLYDCLFIMYEIIFSSLVCLIPWLNKHPVAVRPYQQFHSHLVSQPWFYSYMSFRQWSLFGWSAMYVWIYHPMFWTLSLSPSSGCMVELTSTLIMEAEAVSETLDCISILTQLITRIDFIAFNYHESFESYMYHSYCCCCFLSYYSFVTFLGCRSRTWSCYLFNYVWEWS